jgi:hypothetical protein
MVLLPAFPVAVLYSQIPFGWWKVIAYLMLAYAIAFIFAYKIQLKSHRMHALGVLISLVFIGSVITVIQDFFLILPPYLNIWKLIGLGLLLLAGCMVIFAIVFRLYWVLDEWICKKLKLVSSQV